MHAAIGWNYHFPRRNGASHIGSLARRNRAIGGLTSLNLHRSRRLLKRLDILVGFLGINPAARWFLEVNPCISPPGGRDKYLRDYSLAES
jgi:hypothetical protein